MKTVNFFLLAVVSVLLAACATLPGEKPDDKVIIGYVFPGERVISPDEVDATKLTHINFAFSRIEDGRLVEGYETDSANYVVLNKLKANNPSLKILVSVGGWGWSDGFSDMALTPESRERFIKSAVRFLKKHDIDGLDLDWEYPGLPGAGNVHRGEDKENFTLLLKECREALDTMSGKKDYLLTIAAAAQQEYLDNTEMGEAARYLDFVNLMTYDMTGEWDDTTGHHAGLFSSSHYEDGASVAKTIRMFRDVGVPSDKMVVGVPFYGRGWSRVPAENNGIGQPGEGIGDVRFWYEDIVKEFIPDPDYESLWDESAQAPYLYSRTDSVFITYENPRSIARKCRFIEENDLKGAMFWQYFTDQDEELLSAIYNGLY
ncbi:MAG: glycoside hydrolase family 18 protein [Bacteroidota bacterium]